jgi:excinuclease UvrABC ATPase subunit
MMPEEQRSALLYGFWIRPGHGTFLKGGKDADGSEVSHWLSWDGLIPAVLQQAERSTDSKWRQAIQTSCRQMACPFCKGSGLGRHASLLPIGPRSLEEWTTCGTVDELLNAIESLAGLPPRATRARARIAACLQALRSGDIRLLETPPAEPRREALALAARLFAGLPTLFA